MGSLDMAFTVLSFPLARAIPGGWSFNLRHLYNMCFISFVIACSPFDFDCR